MPAPSRHFCPGLRFEQGHCGLRWGAAATHTSDGKAGIKRDKIGAELTQVLVRQEHVLTVTSRRSRSAAYAREANVFFRWFFMPSFSNLPLLAAACDNREPTAAEHKWFMYCRPTVRQAAFFIAQWCDQRANNAGTPGVSMAPGMSVTSRKMAVKRYRDGVGCHLGGACVIIFVVMRKRVEKKSWHRVSMRVRSVLWYYPQASLVTHYRVIHLAHRKQAPVKFIYDSYQILSVLSGATFQLATISPASPGKRRPGVGCGSDWSVAVTRSMASAASPPAHDLGAEPVSNVGDVAT